MLKKGGLTKVSMKSASELYGQSSESSETKLATLEKEILAIKNNDTYKKLLTNKFGIQDSRRFQAFEMQLEFLENKKKNLLGPSHVSRVGFGLGIAKGVTKPSAKPRTARDRTMSSIAPETDFDELVEKEIRAIDLKAANLKVEASKIEVKTVAPVIVRQSRIRLTRPQIKPNQVSRTAETIGERDLKKLSREVPVPILKSEPTINYEPYISDDEYHPLKQSKADPGIDFDDDIEEL